MTTSINSSSNTADNNYKYVETASDLNVEGVEFYLGDPINESFGPAIYKDKAHTELATIDELVHFYNTNDLILVGEFLENDGVSIPVRSRVNVIMDESEGNTKVCVLFYHLPDSVEGSQSIGLVSKCSIVAEEAQTESDNQDNENNDNQEMQNL